MLSLSTTGNSWLSFKTVADLDIDFSKIRDLINSILIDFGGIFEFSTCFIGFRQAAVLHGIGLFDRPNDRIKFRRLLEEEHHDEYE